MAAPTLDPVPQTSVPRAKTAGRQEPSPGRGTHRRVPTSLILYGSAVAAIAVACKLHARFVGHYDFTGSTRFAWAFSYLVLLWLATYASGVTAPAQGRSPAVMAAVAVTIPAIGISVLQLVLGSQLLPRFVIGATTIVLLGWYWIWAAGAASRAADRRPRLRVIGVIDAVESAALQRESQHDPARSVDVAGFISAPVAAETGALMALAEFEHPSVVLLNAAALANRAVLQQAVALHALGIRIRSLGQFYEERFRKLPLAEVEQASLLFDIPEIHAASYQRAKRAFDLVIGLAALPVLAVVALVVALANAIASRGPLLFRQERVGKDGRLFVMLKFRTMAVGTTAGPWTENADPRVTRVGKVLRRTHLDELPQVLNVIRGDLSIVGPRPEQPHYVAFLRRDIPFYDTRHLVRPGLTGWAQVNYGYGASSGDALEKLQYEFFYLRRQSLRLDAQILFRTMRCVLSGEGR